MKKMDNRLIEVRNKSRKIWKNSCLIKNKSSICTQRPIFFNDTQSPNYSYFCMKQDKDTLQKQRKTSYKNKEKGNSS